MDEELVYREKLWNERVIQIFLNKSESISFYKIMNTYLVEELDNFREHVELCGIPCDHMIYEILNVVNGLSPSLKDDILIGLDVEDIDLPFKYKSEKIKIKNIRNPNNS